MAPPHKGFPTLGTGIEGVDVAARGVPGDSRIVEAVDGIPSVHSQEIVINQQPPTDAGAY
jgi:hypothetical protein